MEKFFTDPEKIAALGAKYPLKRTGTVDDLAAAACFLLGDDSRWVTGQTLGVDGGDVDGAKLVFSFRLSAFGFRRFSYCGLR